MSYANDAFCLVTLVLFPNSKDDNWFQGCMYCCTYQSLKFMHPLWIHTFFKGYILGPKIVGAWQGSSPSKDTWDFFQHKFSPLKA